jgi:hypothetical protein
MIRDHHDLTMYCNWCVILSHPYQMLTEILFMEIFSPGSTSRARATTSMACTKSSTTALSPRSARTPYPPYLHCHLLQVLTCPHLHPLTTVLLPSMNSSRSFATPSTSPSYIVPTTTLAPPFPNATMPSSPPQSSTASSQPSIKNAK